jgi:5,5'-dehydrodivanillate O-demethylase
MKSVTVKDLAHTAPSTLAGRYLRRFWQPIYYGRDLAPGKAKPVRVMNEDFTIYRGESGAPHLIGFRCAHRGMQLSPGWVEGDSLRCFYHGWKYDGAGRCVEQPAEPEPFCHKVRIPGYPIREYLGLIFAYLGEGDPPEFPRYPEFERSNGLLEVGVDSYVRACNYFNNLENSVDSTHVGFVHRAHRSAFDGLKDSPVLSAEESEWGVTFQIRRPSGIARTQQVGMPNIFHMHTSIPSDRELGWKESLIWWVPLDDESHIQFRVNLVPVTGEAAEKYKVREAERLAKIVPHGKAAEEILAGRMTFDDVEWERTDMVRLQDDVAQIGQGRVADREHERLGRGDIGVILLRKIWLRELQALADGKPLKNWRRPAALRPVNWHREQSAAPRGEPQQQPA